MFLTGSIGIKRFNFIRNLRSVLLPDDPAVSRRRAASASC